MTHHSASREHRRLRGEWQISAESRSCECGRLRLYAQKVVAHVQLDDFRFEEVV
jgi:hypothetical protein